MSDRGWESYSKSYSQVHKVNCQECNRLEEFIHILADRLAKASMALGRAAERRGVYRPPSMEELEQYAGPWD